jgi:hypothetical protein
VAYVLFTRVSFYASIETETVFERVELPAGVADLDASLTNMKGDDFSHFTSFFSFSTLLVAVLDPASVLSS